MADNRFLNIPSKPIPLKEGRSYYVDFVNKAFLYFYNQRQVLSSIFNEQNQSTLYALHLRARAREMARIRLFIEDVYDDVNLDSSKSAFLYKTFGSFLQIDEPFFFSDKSDLFYRRFIKAFMSVLLLGSTKQAINQGLAIFCQGLGFEVEEGYVDPFRRLRNAARLASFTTYTEGPPQIDYSANADIYKKNIFYVKFKLDQLEKGVDLDFIYKGVDFFLDIMKPAHNAYVLKWVFEDTYTLAANCQVEYDLILNEKIADSVKKDAAGIEVTAKERNILVLADSTRLFVTNDTDLLASDSSIILYSNFVVGDKVLYTAHNTQGRFKYTNAFADLPPSILYSYVGYVDAPLVENISPTLLASNIFQMYVVKTLDASGFAKETKTVGICDAKKDRVYTWYYDDFRKCGSFKETQVTLEDVSDTYSALTNTIQLDNFPVTNGLGTGELAETITVLVDGLPTFVSNVSALTGLVTLSSPVSSGAVIQASYYHSKNLAYGIDENVGFFNKVANTGFGAFSNILNSDLFDGQKKTRWKLKSFFLPGSSLLNLPFSLLENTESDYRERLNQFRLALNYETKACKIFDRNARFGLSLDGECLNYPTPPVQLRYSTESKLPDPWKLVEGSDVLNKLGKVLNDPKKNKEDLSHLLLNNVFRRLFFGPYDKRYSFTDIEKSDCGGSRTFYPFCDSFDLSFNVNLADVIQDAIKPDIDYLRLTNEDYLENKDILYGVEHTGCIFKVSVKQAEDIPVFSEDLTINLNLNNMMQDTYKNPPLNIIIENAYETTPDPGTTVYSFDPSSNIFNNPLEMDNNTIGDILNDAAFIASGIEYGEDSIEIPPSRVFPGDGIDVVPLELKETPADTNYVFTGRRTFNEDLFWDLNYAFDDVYQFPTERYVLNNPPYGLNQSSFILNASSDMLTLG